MPREVEDNQAYPICNMAVACWRPYPDHVGSDDIPIHTSRKQWLYASQGSGPDPSPGKGHSKARMPNLLAPEGFTMVTSAPEAMTGARHENR